MSASLRVHRDSLTTLYCYDRSGDRFKCMVVLVTLRDALGEPAYTLGFQVRVTNDADKLGKALLAVDATLRRLPRSTVWNSTTGLGGPDQT